MSSIEQQPLLPSGPTPHIRAPAGPFTSRLKKARYQSRELLAEFLGTFVIVFIGDGVVAQYVLSGGSHGSWLGINVAWAGAVMLASLVAGSVSGAHLNPAVSICFAVVPSNGARFPWRKLPAYIIAQMVGGFTAAAFVYAQYRNQIDLYEGGLRTVPGVVHTQETGVTKGPTSGIFATYPLPSSHWTTSFLSEFLAAFLLMLGIYAISSKRNAGLGQTGAALSVFVLLICVGAADGWQTGYAINAARDLAPRIFTALIYGRTVFTAFEHYWWIPVVAPIFGCLFGGAVWTALVGEDEGELEI